jgi:hypothetical protein
VPLVEKLGDRLLLSMNPKGEGGCTFMVLHCTFMARPKVDGELSIHFDDTEAEEEGVEVVLNKTRVNCGGYCLYGCLTQLEWKCLHKTLISTDSMLKLVLSRRSQNKI